MWRSHARGLCVAAAFGLNGKTCGTPCLTSVRPSPPVPLRGINAGMTFLKTGKRVFGCAEAALSDGLCYGGRVCGTGHAGGSCCLAQQGFVVQHKTCASLGRHTLPKYIRGRLKNGFWLCRSCVFRRPLAMHAFFATSTNPRFFRQAKPRAWLRHTLYLNGKRPSEKRVAAHAACAV